MTQEEKAKRYDEALHKAKNYYSTTDSSSDIKLIGLIFPELKESDDEKISKALVEMVHDTTGDSLWVDYNVHKEDAIAWLEKQGEHANFLSKIQIGDKVTRNKDGVIVNLSQLKRVAKPVEPMIVGQEPLYDYTNANICQKDFAEQKPADKVEPKFKVKYAGCEYDVLEVKDTAGVTYYGIEDEPNHIDYVKADNCEIISGGYGIKENGSPYPTKPAVFSEQQPTNKVEPKFKVGDWVVSPNGVYWHIDKISNNRYEVTSNDGVCADWPLHTDLSHLWTIQDAKDGDVLVSESTCGLGTWYCIFKSLDGDESMTVYCYLARDGRFETKKELCFDKDPYNTNPSTKEQRDLLFQKMHDAGYEWDAEKKELKKIEQKPAWSEEDKDFMCDTLSNLTELKDRYGEEYGNVGKCIDWLKSLKDRYTWKPSDESFNNTSCTCLSKKEAESKVWKQ